MKTLLSLFLIAMTVLWIGSNTASARVKGYGKYCGGNEFYPSKKPYPHLHCDTGWITLSRGKRDHSYLVDTQGRFQEEHANIACENLLDNNRGLGIIPKIRQLCDDEDGACTSCPSLDN